MPIRAVVLGFAVVVVAGTGCLMLPGATASGASADWVTALFTSTSTVCVTGLVVVDTGAYWSVFGEVVIAVLIQAGGLGIMTLATVLTLLVSRQLGLRARMAVQAETKARTMLDLRKVVR
ncbi:hypothetical protein [Herbidospora daliensis]|uniref:hypothetical protein n=1 Tax=Herbidospora daliensis TaxID=295585 RepID=UPI000A3E3BE4